MSNLNITMSQAASAVNDPKRRPWDVSFAYYDPPEALTWNLGAGIGLLPFSAAAQTGQASSIFFKPDGTKMYILGYSYNKVHEYDLITPWVTATASFVQDFSVGVQETSPQGLFFHPDGTKMYVLGGTGRDVNEYNLITPWDVSTAVYIRVFGVAGQDGAPLGMFFRSDGLKMYIAGAVGDRIYEYNLSTAWNVSTAAFLQSFSVSAQGANPSGVSFNTDGTKMFVFSQVLTGINSYNLSTPWDVSSASYVKNEISFGSNAGVADLFISPDGFRLYTIGVLANGSGPQVQTFNIGGFDVGPQEANTTGIFFKPDGTKMYVIGTTGDDVNEYNLSTAWDTSTASFLQLFSVAAQEITPQSLFFKPDGTKMYVIGFTGDDVNEYDLSVPWNVSTASFVRLKSIAIEESVPTGLFFKPDGTKMYVIGDLGRDVNEYNLSTPWFVNTASFLQLFSVSAEETSPKGLFFHPEGTKMYVIGTTGDAVYEYNLSTAWDVSTASYTQSSNFYGGNPVCLFFKDDGTQMFVAFTDTNDAILSYTLGVPAY